MSSSFRLLLAVLLVAGILNLPVSARAGEQGRETKTDDEILEELTQEDLELLQEMELLELLELLQDMDLVAATETEEAQ